MQCKIKKKIIKASFEQAGMSFKKRHVKYPAFYICNDFQETNFYLSLELILYPIPVNGSS